MKQLFKIQQRIVPELTSLAENRYNLLRNIYYKQPVGRRTLAENTIMSERTVRNEIVFLQKKGLISISRAGAIMTEAGLNFLSELDIYIKEIKGTKILEERLKVCLGLKEVFIVPGELESFALIQEIGRFTARLVKELLQDEDILAVTGGTTLAHVAKSMHYNEEPLNVMVVPGRGGLGEEVEIQANTIAATIAKKLGGKYQLLQIPDNLKQENIHKITSEPSIAKTLKSLKKANILLHGVGNAKEMARRRGMSSKQIKSLLNAGATGEAFGYYFNEKGEIVYTTTSVGMHLDDIAKVKKVIAVAGGLPKAKAITSVVSPSYQDLLVCDELTAKQILALKGGDG